MRTLRRFGCVVLLAACHPTAAQARQNACYDISVGPWAPIDSTHTAPLPRPPAPDVSADSMFYSLPSRVQLDMAAPYPGAPVEAHLLRVPSDALQVPHSLLMWQTHGDSLVLSISTGFAGTVSRVSRTGLNWVGWARTFSDVGGLLRYRRPIRLDRVDCDTPPPIPASADPPLLRGFEFEGIGLLQLGDSLPTTVNVVPRRSGAVTLLVEAKGLWAGADTVVARLSPSGHLQHIELRYPEGRDLTAAAQAVQERYGPGQAPLDSSGFYWRNRTTELFVTPKGGRPRVMVLDPRGR